MLNSPQITFLLDPNDTNTDKLIEVMNNAKPQNVWVWCSTSSWEEVSRVLSRLSIVINLFPGNIDQIKFWHDKVKEIMLASPLHPINEVTLGLKKELEEILPKIKKPIRKMSYVLLTIHCSAARVLWLLKVPDNQVIIDALEKENPEIIYIEWWSRTNRWVTDNSCLLMTRIKERLPNSRIIYGGWIWNNNDIKNLWWIAHEVIISHAIHESPDSLDTFINL
jgi:heptaprenylglyceryl phosphate synthase